MALLDRFKSQPPWKSPDASVRLQAVATLDEPEAVVALATEDPDAGVRRAAVARLADVEVLAKVSRADADERVRAEARSKLTAVALAARDGDAGASAVAAIEGERELATLAKQAPLQSVAEAALARLADPRLLSATARHAIHDGIRTQALSRIADLAEVADIAQRTEYKDVGLAAVERITDVALLEQISTRARQRAVGRRARALLRALNPEPATGLSPAARQHLEGICASIESLAKATDPLEASKRLSHYEQRWAEADEPDDALALRFGQARTLAQQRIVDLDQQRETTHKAEQAATEGLLVRRRLCEEVETLFGEGSQDRLEAIQTTWRGLEPLVNDTAAKLGERFDRAVADVERRYRTWQSDEERRGRLGQLAQEAAELTQSAELPDAQRRWPVLEREWRSLAAAGPSASAQTQWDQAHTRLRDREAAAREERARKERENLSRWERLCERLEKMLAADITLKDGERALKESRPSADQIGHLPTRQDRDRIQARLDAVHGALLPKVHELRDMEEWKRWANAGVQEELCARTEALREATDLSDAARQLRDIRKQWSQVSTVPNAVSQALWNRFKAACDDVRAKCDAHFAQEAASREDHLKAKLELCERAEALADSTDWIKTAEELQALQAKWKTTGSVGKDQAQALFMRFRAACDRFFTRRKNDLNERKGVWSANQSQKEALCVKAEQLADSTDWANAAAALKALQAEWRTVGPVRRNKSEQLWKRFRAASDKFFDRYKNRDQFEMGQRVALREKLCADIEQLADTVSAGAEIDGPSVRAKVQTIWTSWRHAPPIPREQVDALQTRFEGALGRVVASRHDLFKRTDLDFEANRRRREDLCAQVEALVSGRRSAAELGTAPAQTLATLLREALAANTIGGRVDADAQRRAAREALRELQEAWKRVGPVPGDAGRQLIARFQAAVRRFGPPDEPSRSAHTAPRRPPAPKKPRENPPPAAP
ncbi:MAG: DUF349 domain-containing protein [Vicinamibacterales bacterium]